MGGERESETARQRERPDRDQTETEGQGSGGNAAGGNEGGGGGVEMSITACNLVFALLSKTHAGTVWSLPSSSSFSSSPRTT